MSYLIRWGSNQREDFRNSALS